MAVETDAILRREARLPDEEIKLKEKNQFLTD